LRDSLTGCTLGSRTAPTGKLPEAHVLAVQFIEPKPANLTKRQVSRIAEDFAKEVDFFPGDSIEPLVERLQGVITYANDPLQLEDGSLFVYGPSDFLIRVSTFTGPERDRFTIAHELGHYVVHSKLGKIAPMRAERFGSERVEWEANWFAAAFLMPQEDFRATCAKYANDPNLVAARYLVSPKAASIRMEALNIGV
jgi:predicted transcriptional regulator